MNLKYISSVAHVIPNYNLITMKGSNDNEVAITIAR